jgi:hypothetical protein
MALAPKPAPLAEFRVAIGDADDNGQADIDAVFLFKGIPVFDPPPVNADPMLVVRALSFLGSMAAKFRGLVGL